MAFFFFFFCEQNSEILICQSVCTMLKHTQFQASQYGSGFSKTMIAIKFHLFGGSRYPLFYKGIVISRKFDGFVDLKFWYIYAIIEVTGL